MKLIASGVAIWAGMTRSPSFSRSSSSTRMNIRPLRASSMICSALAITDEPSLERNRSSLASVSAVGFQSGSPSLRKVLGWRPEARARPARLISPLLHDLGQPIDQLGAHGRSGYHTADVISQAETHCVIAVAAGLIRSQFALTMKLGISVRAHCACAFARRSLTRPNGTAAWSGNPSHKRSARPPITSPQYCRKTLRPLRRRASIIRPR